MADLGSLFSLEGRTALVTGASSGIGKDAAHTLAQAGAKLVLVARRKERLEDVCGQIEALGGRASVHACDVSDPTAITALAADLAAADSLPDILINSAGTIDRNPFAKVALNDGRAFGPGGDGFVRLNFGCPRALLADGVARMAAALARRTEARR